MYCQQCGNPTEEREIHGRVRPVCTGCGAVTWLDPKVAVAVVIARGGKVLLGLRAEGAREAGKWGIPAGFVDRGEVVEDAAIREIAEETGLWVTLGRILTVISSPGESVVLLVFPAATIHGEPRPGDDLTAVDWFEPDHLPPLAFPHDARIIDLWRSDQAPRT